MTTDTRPTPLSAALPAAIDDYVFQDETQRAWTAITPSVVAGHSLTRATAHVRVGPEPAEWDAAREAHRRQVLPNTLDPDSPVVELGWPASGHYLMSSRGVEMDLMLGVAQKLVDDRHPAIVRATRRLDELGLLV